MGLDIGVNKYGIPIRYFLPFKIISYANQPSMFVLRILTLLFDLFSFQYQKLFKSAFGYWMLIFLLSIHLDTHHSKMLKFEILMDDTDG